MDCLMGKSNNPVEISASTALHVKPLCRNTIPISRPKFRPKPYVICIPGVHIWPNNNFGRNFGQKNAKQRIDTPKSLAMRGRTHTTVTYTTAHRNQSQSWVSTPMCSASSKASKEATLSTSQSISRSLSQESMAMEESSGAGACTTRGCTGGYWGGVWLGAWGVALGARQSHQEQQAVHGWQRGWKHVQYAIPLARQQCERVHLFVKDPQHPQEPWYAQPDFALHATEPLSTGPW